MLTAVCALLPFMSSPPLGDLARAFLEQARREHAFLTIYECHVFPVVSVGDTPDFKHDFKEDEWISREIITTSVSAGRMVASVLQTSRDFAGRQHTANVWWDGSMAWIESVAGSVFTVRGQADTIDEKNLLLRLNVLEGLVPTRHYALSKILDEAELMHTEVEGNTLTARYHRGAPNRVQAEVVFQIDPPRLLRFRHRYSFADDVDSFDEHLMLVSSLDFEEFLETDFGLTLPSRAVYRSVGRGDGTDPSAAWRTGQWVYTLNTVENMADYPENRLPSFSPVLEPGITVIDERLNLRFVVGNRDINVDGVNYRVNEPILSHPGAIVRDFLRDAEIIIIDDSSDLFSDPPPDHRPGSQTWEYIRRWMTVSGGIAVVMLLPVLGWRLLSRK